MVEDVDRSISTHAMFTVVNCKATRDACLIVWELRDVGGKLWVVEVSHRHMEDVFKCSMDSRRRREFLLLYTFITVVTTNQLADVMSLTHPT